ncbi:MAG: hypothetical protein RLN89_03990 [Parvibaculum sp.]
MPSPHYAISEAFLVGAALWAGFVLMRHNHTLAAMGTLLFGMIAAIGVWRFGTNAIEEWAEFHRAASLTGGVVALGLILGELILLRFTLALETAAQTALVGVALFLGGVGFLYPSLATPLALLMLVGCVLVAALLPAANMVEKVAAPAIFGLFLVNAGLVRQSTLLGPDLSWHLYHMLIGIWCLGLTWIFSVKRSSAR